MATTTATASEIEAAVLPMFRDARDQGYLFGGEKYVQECADDLAEWAVNKHWNGVDGATFEGDFHDLFIDYQDYLIGEYYG